jgi:hypothetical protein
MKKNNVSILFLGVFALIFSLKGFSDGTKQASPANSADGAALFIAPDLSSGNYLGAANEQRIRFTITDNVKENLYFGFQPRAYGSVTNAIVNNVYYRIYDQNGNQIVGATQIPSSSAQGL